MEPDYKEINIGDGYSVRAIVTPNGGDFYMVMYEGSMRYGASTMLEARAWITNNKKPRGPTETTYKNAMAKSKQPIPEDYGTW